MNTLHTLFALFAAVLVQSKHLTPNHNTTLLFYGNDSDPQ